MEKEPTPRFAIYARYSDVLQNPLSIEDQVSLCRWVIAQKWPGADEPLVFSDPALSGDLMMHRPGLAKLLAAAQEKAFDWLVLEGLDRVSRSLKDVSLLYEMLKYHGVSMLTKRDGEITVLHVGLKGTMNALYLTDMKDQVRRGQRGKAERGLSPAGLPYGYRVVKGVVDERGEPIRGIREIDDEKAAVVRWIFEMFAEGERVRRIAQRLNDEGVSAPGGGIWRENGIRGTSNRGDGILRNEIYKGVLVYNRTHLVTNPVTGRKKYVVNPETIWTRAAVPHLRIVENGLWAGVQTMLARRAARLRCTGDRAESGVPVRKRRLRRPPIRDLVMCGSCGRKKTMKDSHSYLCTGYKLGECRNARGTRVTAIRAELFTALRQSLESLPPVLPSIHELMDQARQEQADMARAIGVLDKKLGNLLRLVEEGLKIDESISRVRVLETERRELRDRLERLFTPPETENDVRDQLLAGVTFMEDAYEDRAWELSVREGLALVVERITLTPLAERRTGETIEVDLRPAGWARLWRLTQSWPPVSGEDPVCRSGAIGPLT